MNLYANGVHFLVSLRDNRAQLHTLIVIEPQFPTESPHDKVVEHLRTTPTDEPVADDGDGREASRETSEDKYGDDAEYRFPVFHCDSPVRLPRTLSPWSPVMAPCKSAEPTPGPTAVQIPSASTIAANTGVNLHAKLYHGIGCSRFVCSDASSRV